MASEYIKYQLRDVKPAEPPKPLTKEEKLRNWFDYHKWHLVIAAVLIIIAADLAHSAYVSARSVPDYQIAYVGTKTLPSDTVSALGAAAAAFGEDLTGNGEITVSVVQYVKNTEEAAGNEAVAGSNTASEIRLMADLEDCTSAFFLLEDPEAFEESYMVLQPLSDGRLALPFEEVPGLANADLGTYEESLITGETVSGESAELLTGLSLARRLPREGSENKNQEAYDAFWSKLTGGK